MLHRFLFLKFILEEILKFLIDTFTVNTLQEILPYSEKESKGDFDRLSFIFKIFLTDSVFLHAKMFNWFTIPIMKYINGNW